MNNQEHFINGFLKRAMEYGLSEQEAVTILKQSSLVGDQHKIDTNKNGKIDAQDLAMLRKGKGKDKEDAAK
jgi:hypothetical protein